jgi:hypothetical protein
LVSPTVSIIKPGETLAGCTLIGFTLGDGINR